MSDSPLLERAPVILALDTSSSFTSIALAIGERLAGLLAVELSGRRSERLWTEIRFLLRESDLTINDVDLFAVCTGPGGFTGVRVGVAATKGFAIATGKPVVGITSLQALAAASPGAPLVLVMTGSYRGEIFSQLFSAEGDVPVAQTEAAVTTSREAIQRVAAAGNLVLIGDAVVSNLDVISEVAGARLVSRFEQGREGGWVVSRGPLYLAELIARLAYVKYRKGEISTAAELVASYIRPADAELKRRSG